METITTSIASGLFSIFVNELEVVYLKKFKI